MVVPVMTHGKSSINTVQYSTVSTTRSYLIWCIKLLTIHAQIQRRIGF